VKKSDFNLKLRRHYEIRHGMLDAHYITLEQFMNEVISVAEEFMIPKPTRVVLDTPDGDIPSTINEWG